MPSSAIRPVRWVARSNPIVVRGDQYPVPSDVGVRLQVAVPECHGDLERDKRVLGGLAGPTAVGECDWPGVIEEGVHWLRSAPPILSGPNPPGISPYSGPGFAPIHGPRRNAVPSTAFDTGRPTLPGISASAEPRLISRRIPPHMEEGFAVMAGARWSATLQRWVRTPTSTTSSMGLSASTWPDSGCATRWTLIAARAACPAPAAADRPKPAALERCLPAIP